MNAVREGKRGLLSPNVCCEEESPLSKCTREQEQKKPTTAPQDTHNTPIMIIRKVMPDTIRGQDDRGQSSIPHEPKEDDGGRKEASALVEPNFLGHGDEELPDVERYRCCLDVVGDKLREKGGGGVSGICALSCLPKQES